MRCITSPLPLPVLLLLLPGLLGDLPGDELTDACCWACSGGVRPPIELSFHSASSNSRAAHAHRSAIHTPDLSLHSALSNTSHGKCKRRTLPTSIPSPHLTHPAAPATTLLQGDVLCCDGCRAVYHLACIGLSQMPGEHEDFFCPLCSCKECGKPTRSQQQLPCINTQLVPVQQKQLQVCGCVLGQRR